MAASPYCLGGSALAVLLLLFTFREQLVPATTSIQEKENASNRTTPSKNGITTDGAPAAYRYRYELEFAGVDSHFVGNRERCSSSVAAALFEQICRPRRATCHSNVTVLNDHGWGIGHALTALYMKEAAQSLKERADCAPMLKEGNADTGGDTYVFQLLDYFLPPSMVVDARGYAFKRTDGVGAANAKDDKTKKCIMYSITRPRDIVLEKVRETQSQFQGSNSTEYPLVAIHLRTGWSDELQRQAAAWEALDRSDVYEDNQLPIDMIPHAIAEIELEAVLSDTAHYADRVFGTGRWRLYFATDAPGLRRYVRHALRSRASGIAWNNGPIGHNSMGGSRINERRKSDHKRETAVSAASDLVMMSEADVLVSVPSRFSGAAELRSTCPQRTVHLGGYPRDPLSNSGLILALARGLHKEYGVDTVTSVLNVAEADVAGSLPNDASRNESRWSPRLTDGMRERFFSYLRGGAENPCTRSEDSVRACFCMLKLAHQ